MDLKDAKIEILIILETNLTDIGAKYGFNNTSCLFRNPTE